MQGDTPINSPTPNSVAGSASVFLDDALDDMDPQSPPVDAGSAFEDGFVFDILDSHKLKKRKKLLFMATITGTFLLVELGAGLYTRSIALVADAFHMFSDLLSIVIALVALKVSRRRPDEVMTYGWSRSEVLAALCNGVFLLALSFSIIISAIERFLEPTELRDPVVMVSVACVGLAVNLVALAVVGHDHGHDHGHTHGHGHSHGHSHSHEHSHRAHGPGHGHVHRTASSDLEHAHGGSSDIHHSAHGDKNKKHRDLNLHGVFLHVMGDALGSVGAIVCGLVIWLTEWEHRFILDPLTSVFIALIIAFHTVPLVRSSARVLMMSTPERFGFVDLRKDINSLDGVISAHDLHVWQLDDRRLVGTVHVLLDSKNDYEDLSKRIQILFHDHGVHMVTIQPEFTVAEKRSCQLTCMDVSCQPYQIPPSPAARAAFSTREISTGSAVRNP